MEKVRDIVGLYLDPPERALVLCADEKSQIQALDHTQPLLPMRPGQVEARLDAAVARPAGATRCLHSASRADVRGRAACILDRPSSDDATRALVGRVSG